MIWEIDEETPEIEGIDRDGRPIASYAASLGLIRAPFGRRVASTSIEVVVVLLLQLPFLLIALPAAVAIAGSPDPQAELAKRGDLLIVILVAAASSLLTTAFIIVQMVLHGRRGVTVGKAIFGIRSINVRTLERPGFWRGAVVRYLIMWGSFAVPLIGPLVVIALSPLFDPEKRGRGWPDLVAATWFVDVRNGLNPYDAKRMRIARKTVATNLSDERRPLPSLATPVTSGGVGTYVPSARSVGGVLGAHRADNAAPAAQTPLPPSSAPLPAPAREADVPSTPRGNSTSAASASGMISAVPGSLRVIEMEMRLDTGQEVSIDGGGVLIGRDPSANPNDIGMSLFGVTDDGKSISKTHLALIRSGTSLIAVDRWSTNGSAIVRNGVERTLIPGEGVDLVDADTIRFGDRHAEIRIR